MKINWNRSYLALCAFVATVRTVDSIRCYRCDSTEVSQDPFQCDEFFEDTDLEPQSCDDVYGAKYCIKQIGRFRVSGIKCFQCSSATNISCSDLLIHDGGILPLECEHIFEAEYCIKVTGGGIGTQRNCSSVDLGNYCNYVQHVGDNLEYRSCIFTCTGDGCNSSPSTVGYSLLVLVTAVAVTFLAPSTWF